VPQDVSKITDKANLLKSIIEQLVATQTASSDKINESGLIACKDCLKYETNLQKL
jgi:hypothetical protein